MDKIVLDILTGPNDILKALIDSKRSGSLVGLTSEELGPGAYFTCVTDIITLHDDRDPLIILKSYDMTGYFLDTNSVRLSDITSVIPLTSILENPFLRKAKAEAEKAH